jgi:VIT1/CCC1 family predicted Fe2+/Mn2+ transporter
MTTARGPRFAPVLDPIDRISEALFGLIMVLTFTGTLSATDAGRTEIRDMLIGALGCNFAWGIIDGILFLMGCLAEEGRSLRTLRAVRASADPADAHRLLAESVPGPLAPLLSTTELETMRRKAVEMAEPPRRPGLGKDEWLGALSVFLWVMVVTFPVAVPFIFMTDAPLALRTSNAIAIALLYFTGHAFGRATGGRPWFMGLSMILVGIGLVGLTILFGG